MPVLRYSLAAAILALGLIASSVLISRFFVRIRHEKEIAVKGFARADITADRGSISYTLKARHPRREQAYRDLVKQVGEVEARVRESAPDDLDVETGNVRISERKRLDGEGDRTHEIESYGAEQSVTLASSDVHWIRRIGPDLNALLGKGYDIEVGSPTFRVADLAPIKQDLLEQAAADGLRRARILASHGGARVGPLRSARQGVFQITRPESVETSSYGKYDTSTIEKSIRAVVTLEYSVD